MAQEASAAPTVSVITPAHNNAHTIDAAIASVQAQTFEDWEHVICDDASTDDTSEHVAAAAARDPRIKLVRGSTNVGPAGARNLALQQAQGANMALLDADDSYRPSYLETMIGCLKSEGPGVGIVCCDAWLIDESGSRLGLYSERVGSPDAIDLAGLLRANRIFGSAVTPRAIVDQAGRFSTECWGSEDHDLWLRIVELGYRVAFVDEPLVSYLVAEGSVSSSRVSMARTDQATFRRALERGRLNPQERRIARARLNLALAAEAVAVGARLSAVPILAKALVARLVLSRA